MTIKELRDRLAVYDDNLQVALGCESDPYSWHLLRGNHTFEIQRGPDGPALVLTGEIDWVSRVWDDSDYGDD